jgi:hypothetical protein
MSVRLIRATDRLAEVEQRERRVVEAAYREGNSNIRRLAGFPLTHVDRDWLDSDAARALAGGGKEGG